jgi:hypothetical protein
MTNQEDRYDSFVTIASAAGTETYDEVIRAAAVAELPAAVGTTDELLMQFLQNRLSSAATNINDLKQEFAVAEGVPSWDELGAFL